MKSLQVSRINCTNSHTILTIGGRFEDAYYKFDLDQKNISIVGIHDEDIAPKEYIFMVLANQSNTTFDVTDSLNENFKHFKTVVSDEGYVYHIFIREIL